MEPEIQTSRDETIREVQETKKAEEEQEECKIDINSSGGEQKVCRICHLGSGEWDESSSSSSSGSGNGNQQSESVVLFDLEELGCGCKDDLGVSHRSCAEKWFKQRGNRLCEICGKTARNISIIVERRTFMVECEYSTSPPTPRGGGESQWKHPCCNLLLGCLVMAIILPLFFFL